MVVPMARTGGSSYRELFCFFQGHAKSLDFV
ncbi:hypothetical protein IHE45_19G045500 [Dioscorea alata]|uniref:Uncharacterized protein n=1 Tax=Dioscorea alata TaxID=55571 RepID=A0ACB7TXU4_DIOAL|nr:hypothetical protein IHE45_19G045500 [Dioscorea alata]